MFKTKHRLHRLHAIAAEPETGSDTATEETAAADETGDAPARTYSQAEIDQIVEKRLARVRKQYGDYEDMKAKAARLDEIEAASKSELERLEDANKALEAKLAQREHEALIQSACLKHSIPEEYADLVAGADEEAIEAAAKKVGKLVAAKAKDKPRPVPGEGDMPQGKPVPDLDARIRAAEQSGNVREAMHLKTMKLASN